MRAFLSLFLGLSLLAVQILAEKLQVQVVYRLTQGGRRWTFQHTLSIPDGQSQRVHDSIEAWTQMRFRGVWLQSGRLRVVNVEYYFSENEALQEQATVEHVILHHVGSQ